MIPSLSYQATSPMLARACYLDVVEYVSHSDFLPRRSGRADFLHLFALNVRMKRRVAGGGVLSESRTSRTYDRVGLKKPLPRNDLVLQASEVISEIANVKIAEWQVKRRPESIRKSAWV